METKFNTIEEILEDLRQGKIVMMMDDEDRENEGDVICAAEHATLENVNFMATYARGLICMPMSQEYTDKLHLPQMCSENTDNHCTAFTVSIDHKDTTTGISAEERALTARMVVDDQVQPWDEAGRTLLRDHEGGWYDGKKAGPSSVCRGSQS